MSAAENLATRILIAEDSPVYRKLLEIALAGQTYDVRFATNGSEALSLYSAWKPDVLITDWIMPDMSGLDVCKRVRALQNSYTYIILVTQKTEADQLIEGLDAGADDYLAKPFNSGELLARIRAGCRIVRMSREIESKNVILEKAVRTDHLTGLPNRLALEEFGAKHLHAAIRHKFNLWVVVTDLDKFKLVNDIYGHLVGDEAIQRFAHLLRANTRGCDTCGRLGGDEFVLVISHGEKRAIVQVIERLRADLANEYLRIGDEKLQITASFGIAGFTGDGTPTLKELLTRADHALYAAKSYGRNQVRMEIPKVVLQPSTRY